MTLCTDRNYCFTNPALHVIVVQHGACLGLFLNSPQRTDQSYWWNYPNPDSGKTKQKSGTRKHLPWRPHRFMICPTGVENVTKHKLGCLNSGNKT